jgi:hypothetical protein
MVMFAGLQSLMREWNDHSLTAQYLGVLYAIIGRRQQALDALARLPLPHDWVSKSPSSFVLFSFFSSSPALE